MDLSVVIPFLNEEESLPELISWIDKVMRENNFSYEIIRALRKELTEVCVTYLDADLFILDEFQKFKSRRLYF